MTTALDGHIEVDDRGIARIAGSRMKVIYLVMDKMANHWGPEEMAVQFPSLSLAQIHAAFAYYYDHKPELDAQIEETRARAEDWSNNAFGQPTHRELEERLERQSGNQP